jgi:hypothetical protein
MSAEVKEIEALFKSRKGLNDQIDAVDAKIRDLKNSVIGKIVKDVKASNEYKNYVKASNDLLNRERKSVFKTFTIIFHLKNVDDYADFENLTFRAEIDSLQLDDKAIVGYALSKFSRDINQDYFCNEALHLIPNLSNKAKKLKDIPELGYDAVDESIESLLAFKEFTTSLATKLKLVVEVEYMGNGRDMKLKILSFNGTKVGKKLISQNINGESFSHLFDDNKDDDIYDKLLDIKKKAWTVLCNKIDKSVDPYAVYIGAYVVNDRIRADLQNEIKAK